MQNLLNEIDIRLSGLMSLLVPYNMPENMPAGKIIDHFLDHQETQRAINQNIVDLTILKDMVQGEIEAIQIQAQEKAIIEKTKEKQKSQAAETKKILKQLSKLDPCSPDATKALLNLSIIGR